LLKHNIKYCLKYGVRESVGICHLCSKHILAWWQAYGLSACFFLLPKFCDDYNLHVTVFHSCKPQKWRE